MCVEHSQDFTVHIHVSPHCAVVGLLERHVFGGAYWVAAENNHVVVALCVIWEIVLVNVDVSLVAHLVVILLQAEHVHLFLLHLVEDVVGDECYCLASESSHVVACNLQRLPSGIVGG